MTNPSGGETAEQALGLQRALDAFLVENPELEALNARLSRFNAFQVLRVERAEIRHSNVLAWLLTSNESHVAKFATGMWERAWEKHGKKVVEVLKQFQWGQAT